MARRRKRQDSAQTPWQEFERLHRGHAHLTTNTLYALPEPLILILREQVPNLWSAADLSFEFDLSRLAGGGFFYQRLYWFSVNGKFAFEGLAWLRDRANR